MLWEPASAEESATEGLPCRTALEQHEDAAEKEFGRDGLPLIMRWDNCSDASHRALTHAVDMEAQVRRQSCRVHGCIAVHYGL